MLRVLSEIIYMENRLLNNGIVPSGIYMSPFFFRCLMQEIERNLFLRELHGIPIIIIEENIIDVR